MAATAPGRGHAAAAGRAARQWPDPAHCGTARPARRPWLRGVSRLRAAAAAPAPAFAPVQPGPVAARPAPSGCAARAPRGAKPSLAPLQPAGGLGTHGQGSR